MKIVFNLIHDDFPQENEAQINEFLTYIEIREKDQEVYDAEGIPHVVKRKYYALKDFAENHEVLFYHIIPYQEWNISSPYEAVKPSNLNLLDGPCVAYGIDYLRDDKGEVVTSPDGSFILHEDNSVEDIDESKVFLHKNRPNAVYRIYGKKENYPLLFNKGLLRGTDLGGDIVVYIEDVYKFNFKKFLKKLSKILDKNDTTEFAEDDYGKITSTKVLTTVGLLDEKKQKNEALGQLKQRIVGKGMKHG